MACSLASEEVRVQKRKWPGVITSAHIQRSRILPWKPSGTDGLCFSFTDRSQKDLPSLNLT